MFYESEISRNLSAVKLDDSARTSRSNFSATMPGSWAEEGKEPRDRHGSPDVLAESFDDDLKGSYESGPPPRLTYETMDEYSNEMSYKIYQEEMSNLPPSRKQMLTSNDFSLEWCDDHDMRSEKFSLSILMTKSFCKKHLSQTSARLNKSPFFVGQGMLLMLPDQKPWYCVVTSSEVDRHWEETSEPKILEVSIKKYSWNKNPLPTTQKLKKLEILPVSVPNSRALAAISKLKCSTHVPLLMGKTVMPQGACTAYPRSTASDSLNESQKFAIQTVLSSPVTVIQGPPGTGKTSTIHQMVVSLLACNKYPILVVAASNVAVDNMAEKLMSENQDSIVRLVAASKEFEYESDHEIGSICLHNKVFKSMTFELQRLMTEMNRPHSRISLRDYKMVTREKINRSQAIINRSKVILTTSVAAGGVQLKDLSIPVVLMDEATQSSEVTTLIPLALRGVEKFVFVGDQKQLSSFSPIPGLAFSLFERMLANGAYENPIMLDTQYRMHPDISDFPKRAFYGGKIKDGISASDRQAHGKFSRPVVFWDTRGRCAEEIAVSYYKGDDGRTYCNMGEVKYVERVLDHLIQVLHVDRSDIGVITPYRGQRDLLSEELVKSKVINPSEKTVLIETNKDEFNESKSVTVHMVAGIMIASIDAFQGREKDFIVLSCVRSNDSNRIGFLSDKRRLNVPLTRARHGLVLVGDRFCLKSGDYLWKTYMNYLESRNCILKEDSFKMT